MVLIRVTAECSTSIARFLLQLVDERAHSLTHIEQGCTLRDLKRFGIERADAERLPLASSVDLSVPMPSDEKARALIVRAQSLAHHNVAGRERSAFDWSQECAYISRVTDARGNVKEMNFDKATFIRYCEMQRDAAARAGRHDSAEYIQHCIDDLKGEA